MPESRTRGGPRCPSVSTRERLSLGARRRALLLPVEVIWMFFSGREQMVTLGVYLRAMWPLWGASGRYSVGTLERLTLEL